MSASLKYQIDRARADLHYIRTQSELASTSDDATALHDAQVRADAVLGLWSESASAPVPGELPGEYRRRLLRAVQARSDKYRTANLTSVPGDGLEIAEELVYTDARNSVNNPATVPPGMMRQVRERDDLGRMITRYVGSDPVWMDLFAGTHAVGKVNRKLAGVE